MRMPFLPFVCLLAILFGAVSAFAQNATAPVTLTARAGVHPDFDRVVFDLPRAIKHSVVRNGENVTVSFAVPAQTKFGNDFSKLNRARGFSTGVDKDGNLTVSFRVDPNAKLKDFISEKSVVIDVQGSAASVTETKAPEVKAPEVKAADTKPDDVKKADVKPATAEPAPPPPKATEAKAPEKPAVAPPAPLTPAAPDVKAAEPAPAAPVMAPPAQAELPTKPEPLPPAASNIKTGLVTAPTRNAPQLDLGDTPLLIATLDPRTPVRAAVYMRGGVGYIIFDRKLTLALNDLTAGQQAPRVTLEPMDLPNASGFHFALPSNVGLRATRNGTAWQMYVSKQEPDVPVSTLLVAQPDFALGARFLLPVPDAPEPVRLTDPIVGDDLIVIPLEQTQAFSVFRKMADFTILPAAQGLVIKPLTDKITVRTVTDGIEITGEGGLKLSSSADTGALQQSPQKAKLAATGKSIFDFAAWRGKPDETFSQTRQRLQQTIVDVPEAERNRARLELARFYFARGRGEEASALLTYLAKQVPDLMAHSDFIAILGAAKTLANHPTEGLKLLESPVLAGQPEIELWEAVAHAELRDWAAAEEKFAITETILNGYPEPFYSRFSVLAIEAALAMSKDREAADWIDRMENGPHRDEINAALAYLHGVLHAKAGRGPAAEAAWKEAQASRDRLYKIRAELALIDLGVSNGSLTPAQAADRLEALRFGWRGDDLEVDILHRLGQFYIQSKNIKAGLGILSRATMLYPNSSLTPQIRDEMSGIFHDVFLGNLGKNLTPLDALTLYQQYRGLMPAGQDGIVVTHNLAERLVAIDLLDQAADLLEDLVKNKLQGDEKAKTSSRLAAIRLLDHKPEAAMAALEYVKDEGLSDTLRNERVLLRAKAFADMRRDDDALKLLEDNTSQAAKLLRADITMHAQRWDEAGKALLALIGPAGPEGTKATPQQAEWLVNAAIALSLAGDQTELDKLAIDYGPMMVGTNQNDTFRILTQPEKTAQLRDIASAQAKIADIDMFHSFLDNYRSKGSAKDAGAKTTAP